MVERIQKTVIMENSFVIVIQRKQERGQDAIRHVVCNWRIGIIVRKVPGPRLKQTRDIFRRQINARPVLVP
jgi:hypothetical protein